MTTPMRITPPRVQICDALWNPQGELDDWDGLEVLRRVCDVGRGKVDAKASAHNRDLVNAGSTVLVHLADGRILPGLIDPLGEAQPATATIKLSWSDANVYLANDQAVPNPTTATGQGPNVHDLRSGYASTVVLGYVEANIGQTALPERRAPGLLVQADPKIGGWLEDPVEARYDNLLDLCRQVAMPNGIVFDVTTVDRSHLFKVRPMRDLSADAQFSRKLGNLDAGSWSWAAPKATRIRAMGKGEGVDRLILVVTSPESLRQEKVWGRPYWQVHDSSSSETSASLRAEALRKLYEAGETVTVTYNLVQSGLMYGRDYLEGDIVLVTVEGLGSVKKPVREVSLKWTRAASYVVTVVVGDYPGSSTTGGQFATRQIVREVEALKVRR